MPASRPNDAPAIMWRMRDDLHIETEASGRSRTSTIKDPLRLSYFQAQAEEMVFLRLLNGQRSMISAIETLRKQFPTVDFEEDNLRQFLISAINSGILRCCSPGHSDRLTEIRNREASRAILRRALSLLTYRFRGLDPTQLLNVLDRRLGWVYQPKYLVAGVIFCTVAALMVAARRMQIESEMPGLGSLITATNISAFVLSLVFVKVLHELGHGLTCRHYGGECHELGVLIIGFMPLLYCDVSDSWLQLDRRKRMLVAAAGIGTELLIASASAMLWSYSRPGFLHSFFLNVMIVSSLNTLFVNGNPLLKYDGYYILSDLWRIPNLAAEARAAFVGLLDRIILGVTDEPLNGRTSTTRIAMTVYGATSHLYRMVMIVSLLWFMHQTLKSWSMEVASGILIASVGSGFIITGMRGIRDRIRRVPGKRKSRQRASIGLLLTTLFCTGLLTIPLPYTVDAPFTFTPGVSAPVFALEDGSIQSHVFIGQQVQLGDTIAVQKNPDLESEIAQAEGEYRLAVTRAANLAAQRSTNSEASSSLPAAEKAIQSRAARMEMLLKKKEYLCIRSPVSGNVLPPRNTPRLPVSEYRVTSWFGTPLNPENHSEWIGRQTLLCWVGRSSDLRAFCVVPEHDIDLITAGASVSLVFSSCPAIPLLGKVTQRKEIRETSIDRELVVNQLVRVTSFESSRPLETFLGVSIALQDNLTTPVPPLYSTGYATIRCAPMSILRRSWRFIWHVFSFER